MKAMFEIELLGCCISTCIMKEGQHRNAEAWCADLREVDKVGQDSRVVDVQVSLQLIPDGLAQQLHVVVGCLCILLCARAHRYPLRGVIMRSCVTQGAPRLLLTARTS